MSGQFMKGPRISQRKRQRGVVLFVALIAMVMLSLAGVALLRSVDAGTSIGGNLATKQSTITPVNWAVEQAVDAIFSGGPGSITDLFNHDLAHNYYANIQAGEKPNGVPAILYGPDPAGLTTYNASFPKHDDGTANSLYEVRWVIERMCQGSGPAPGPYTGDPLANPDGIRACDLVPPKVANAGTHGEEETSVPPVPLYRLSVRVDHVRSKTVTYAQAMLR